MVGSSSDASSKEEAYAIYQEVTEIIEKDAKVTLNCLADATRNICSLGGYRITSFQIFCFVVLALVTKLAASSQESYPEMDVLWLMTKAWNCGIHLYRLDIARCQTNVPV